MAQIQGTGNESLVKYNHIFALGEEENEGILNELVVVESKADGSQFRIRYIPEQSKLIYGSRNNILPDDANTNEWIAIRAYKKAFEEHKENFIPDVIYYSENMKKHTIEYDNIPETLGYDILDLSTMQFYPWRKAKEAFEAIGIPFIHVHFEKHGKDITIDDLNELIKQSPYRGQGKPDEGLVIKCFDSETEVLTINGWKRYTEVKIGDRIYEFTKDENLIISVVVNVYVYNYKGNMCHLTNRHIDLLATPTHRQIYRTVNKNIYEKQVEDLPTDNYSIPVSSTITGTHHPISFYRLKLLCWIITEGCIDDNTYRISQSIKVNKNNCIEIEKCLKEEGIKYSVYNYQNNQNIYYIPSIYTYRFSELKKKGHKQIPDFFFTMSEEQRRIAIKTLLKGDGGRNGNSWIYSQKSKEHINDFQHLCAITGFATKTTYYKDRDINCCYVSETNKISKTAYSHICKKPINIEEYNGIVWDVDIGGGYIIARRNGRCFITGNSYGKTNKFGRPLFAKIVTKEFKEQNRAVFGESGQPKKQSKENEVKIADQYLNDARFMKAILYFQDEGEPIGMSLMPKLYKYVINDILSEYIISISNDYNNINFPSLTKIIAARCANMLKGYLLTKSKQ